MGIDDLLAKRERAAGTAGTAHVPATVPANPLQSLDGTAGTAGTAENDKGRNDSSETLPTDTAPPIRATHWLLHFADREPLEVWFAPAATHDEVLAGYPDAVAAEPLLDPVAHAAPPRQSCRACRYRKHPGLADPGYCAAGRDDLLPAYGPGHPLRRMPDDGGESCRLFESWSTENHHDL